MKRSAVWNFCLCWTFLLCCQLLTPVLTQGQEDTHEHPDLQFLNEIVEEVTNVQFGDLAKKHPYLLALLYEPSCVTCEEAKKIINTVNAPDLFPGALKMVQAADHDLAATLGVKDFPSLVLMRNAGSPVLYDGEMDKSSIEEWLEAAHERATKTLNDDSFEHLTQASTGATTGDWLVAFYKDSCPSIAMTLESVAVRIKRKMNVAKVDMDLSPRLVKRLKLSKCPTVVYFRQGKMYNYEVEKYDTKSLISFVEGWYKNMKAEKIPLEPTAFDELTENIAKGLKEQLEGPNRFVFLAIAGGVTALVVIVLIMAFVVSKKNAQKKKLF